MSAIRGDVLVGEFPVGAVDHGAHLPGVDEEHLAAGGRARREAERCLVAGEEPEADRDLRGVEELAGQGDDAVDQVGLDDAPGGSRPRRDVLEDSEPLARTKPAMPFGARWWIMCWIQAKLALPTGGVPYFQRASSAAARRPSR